MKPPLQQPAEHPYTACTTSSPFPPSHLLSLSAIPLPLSMPVPMPTTSTPSPVPAPRHPISPHLRSVSTPTVANVANVAHPKRGTIATAAARADRHARRTRALYRGGCGRVIGRARARRSGRIGRGSADEDGAKWRSRQGEVIAQVQRSMGWGKDEKTKRRKDEKTEREGGKERQERRARWEIRVMETCPDFNDMEAKLGRPWVCRAHHHHGDRVRLRHLLASAAGTLMTCLISIHGHGRAMQQANTNDAEPVPTNVIAITQTIAIRPSIAVKIEVRRILLQVCEGEGAY